MGYFKEQSSYLNPPDPSLFLHRAATKVPVPIQGSWTQIPQSRRQPAQAAVQLETEGQNQRRYS